MKKFASNKRSIHLLLVICAKQRERFTYLDISSCMLFARYPQFQQRIHLRFLNPEILRFPPDPLSFQAKARWNGICCCSDLNFAVDGRFQIWFLKSPWSPNSYWGWVVYLQGCKHGIQKPQYNILSEWSSVRLEIKAWPERAVTWQSFPGPTNKSSSEKIFLRKKRKHLQPNVIW